MGSRISGSNLKLAITSMSASAERRGITPQLFAAWGRTQERTVAACPTRPRVVLDSVVHRRQRFQFDTAIMRQSV